MTDKLTWIPERGRSRLTSKMEFACGAYLIEYFCFGPEYSFEAQRILPPKYLIGSAWNLPSAKALCEADLINPRSTKTFPVVLRVSAKREDARSVNKNSQLNAQLTNAI